MRIRRFTLVAFAVTGGAIWLTMLASHQPLVGWYPLAGLVAAMIAAAIPWQPRWVASWWAKLVLSGCVSFAVVGFALPAARDLHVDLGSFGAWIALVWLAAVGVLAELTIVGCRPWQAYLGTVIAFASIVPSVAEFPFEIFAAIVGIVLCALPTLLSAAITRAILDVRQRNRGLDDRAELPAARTTRN